MDRLRHKGFLRVVPVNRSALERYKNGAEFRKKPFRRFLHSF